MSESTSELIQSATVVSELEHPYECDCAECLIEERKHYGNPIWRGDGPIDPTDVDQWYGY